MDVVMLHGTTQSPAGWDLVHATLVKHGHRAYRPDLLTDRPDAVGADYADLVLRQLPAHVSDPVLVAHSGAGLAVPAVADALGARHVVWVAAAIPDTVGGTGFLDQIAAAGPEIFTPEWRGLTEPPTADPVTAAYFLFHDCDLPTSTYIVPTGGRGIRPDWMRRTARERLDANVVEIDAGHCPHVARAKDVAAVVHRLSGP